MGRRPRTTRHDPWRLGFLHQKRCWSLATGLVSQLWQEQRLNLSDWFKWKSRSHVGLVWLIWILEEQIVRYIQFTHQPAEILYQVQQAWNNSRRNLAVMLSRPKSSPRSLLLTLDFKVWLATPTLALKLKGFPCLTMKAIRNMLFLHYFYVIIAILFRRRRYNLQLESWSHPWQKDLPVAEWAFAHSRNQSLRSEVVWFHKDQDGSW